LPPSPDVTEPRIRVVQSEGIDQNTEAEADTEDSENPRLNVPKADRAIREPLQDIVSSHLSCVHDVKIGEMSHGQVECKGKHRVRERCGYSEDPHTPLAVAQQSGTIDPVRHRSAHVQQRQHKRLGKTSDESALAPLGKEAA